MRIHDVAFYCLTSSTWDELAEGGIPASPSYPDSPEFMLRSPSPNPHGSGANTPQVFEHPCAPLTKILGSGSFYYASEPHWDLSSRMSVRLGRSAGSGSDVALFDERFVWNEFIVRSLLDFRERLDAHERDDLDRAQFIVSLSTFRDRPVLSHRSDRFSPSKDMSGFIPFHYRPLRLAQLLP